ncbi:MAG TPA: GIY-YIG nuclease family protein, partial [Terriglobales bacterium]
MIAYFVYIISNKSRRLYIGITSHLPVRILQHKFKVFPDSFTARYNFDILVYFEQFYDPYRAIARETEIKKWRREKKLKLIAEINPHWADL